MIKFDSWNIFNLRINCERKGTVDWKNKMQEAAIKKDLFSSFMNMISFQFMIREIAENVAINEFEIMDHFDPHNVEKNLESFDAALERYLEEYQKVGIQPKCFADVNDFLNKYLETK